jgi:hypothetical protein
VAFRIPINSCGTSKSILIITMMRRRSKPCGTFRVASAKPVKHDKFVSRQIRGMQNKCLSCKPSC